jgi:hypothetical protein
MGAGIALTAALLSASPAGAASAARLNRPSVGALHASKATLGHAGGKIVLTAAAVKHATSCTFSSRKHVGGLPARVSCSSGQATKTLKLAANAGASAVSYKFAVVAAGPDGKSAPRYATVRVRPAAPSVTLSAAPDGLTKAGGAAVISATVQRSTTCELSVTPALAAFPAKMPCAAGTKAEPVSKTVKLPALTGSAAARYSFTLTVTGPGGSARSGATETVWPAMTFSAPKPIMGGPATSVSCVAPSFCAATRSNGVAYFYNGSRWTAQTTLSGVPLVSISCTSATFCMAADDSSSPYGSGAWVWDGKNWTGSLPGIYLTSVSCTSAVFCMAIGNLNTGVFASHWNGGSWSPQTQIDSPAANAQVSCATPGFCAAIDGNGDAMTFNGTSWSAPDTIDAGVIQPLATVSCPTAEFCIAMDGFGQAFTYSGSGWTGPAGVENSAGVTSVSCTSAVFCVAADISGNVITDYSGLWSAPDPADPQPANVFNGFTGISCATVAFCAAVDNDGNISLGTG